MNLNKWVVSDVMNTSDIINNFSIKFKFQKKRININIEYF